MVRLVQIQSSEVFFFTEPMKSRMNVRQGNRLYFNALIKASVIHGSPKCVIGLRDSNTE